MKPIMNPYLPEGTYIPDGEPHVFDGRIYIFGSHDLFEAENYCEGDFEVWSAPVDDLSDWRKDGVIFPRKNPANPGGEKCMWAPDVCRGAAGSFEIRLAPDGVPIAVLPAEAADAWHTVWAELAITDTVCPLYITYRGSGAADFKKLHFA